MQRHFIFIVLVQWFCLIQGFSLSVSSQDALKVGDKIWKNECGGTIDGLTTWKKGENFPSLGIGHFIWYPKGKEERFQESFPQMVNFLEREGASLPPWLKKASGCPWASREEFYREIQSSKMVSLRKFLFETRDLQAIFIARRVEASFPRMIEKLSSEEKERVTLVFNRLASDARGLYALIDYSNFKGDGTSPLETYKGQGWGLLQVLLAIPPGSQNIVADFVQAAKEILTQRIQNSPPERNEKQWLKGWINRLNTSLD